MNSSRSEQHIFDTAASNQRTIYNMAIHSEAIQEQRIITRAIVVEVKRNVELNTITSKSIPQYSIKARIFGEKTPNSIKAENNNYNPFDNWYAPLLPIHNISIPEIGEEVNIIRESTKSSSKGYWVSKVNDTSIINSYTSNEDLAKLDRRRQNDITGYDVDFDKYRKQYDDVSPSRVNRSYAMPVYYGDLIQQGRSDTYIRQSFNPRNKGGVLELGIKRTKVTYTNRETSTVATLGNTLTKTVHIKKGLLTDIGQLRRATEFDVQLIGPFSDGSFQKVPVNVLETEKNMIINIAEEFYNISNKNGVDNVAYRSVLGEKLSEFQEDVIENISLLVDSIEKMSNITGDIIEMYLKHTHVLPEINITLPEKEVEFAQFIRNPPRLESRGSRTVRIPAQSFNTTIQTQGGLKSVRRSTGERTVQVPNPPRLIPGTVRKVTRKKTIKFDDISIGGEGNKRITTSPQTTQAIGVINDDIEKVLENFKKYNDEFKTLANKTRDFLSRNNFIN
jgi:hypothetical protein